MKKFIHILFVLVLIALIGVGVYRYIEYQKYAPLRNDMERIATEDYTSVFFSTFPIDYFTEDDFIYYREIYPLKASYCIPDLDTLNMYFTNVSESWNEVENVYLGVRPDIISAEDLLTLMDTWSDKRFEILIAYPSLSYWKALDEEEYPARLSAYTEFINTLMPLYEDNEWIQGHLSLYFYGSAEWLVGNTVNYEKEFNVNEEISHALSMYMDGDHGYQLTLENYEEKVEDFETLVREYRSQDPEEYPDLSKWDVVFFGDSIIAFTETSSISGAFSGLTGAHTYNCGIGGSTATMTSSRSLGIPAVVDAFLSEDLSQFSQTSLAYAGMSDYFEHAKKKRQKCFVIDYGMNDYYIGTSVYGDDPNDIYTYSGALRTAVDKLQAAYPDAVIVLMAPNFTSYFGCGLEPQSEEGGILLDYVAAMTTICEEKNLLFYNSYTELGIDNSNHTEHLMDGTHPNEGTRYIMAQGLAELLKKQIAED